MIFEINKDSTSKRIYHLIKEEIINLNFIPGLNISEKEISEKFKVSRTPVREAFVRLSQEGLLNIYPQKGTFVSLIDLSKYKTNAVNGESTKNFIMKSLRYYIKGN